VRPVRPRLRPPHMLIDLSDVRFGVKRTSVATLCCAAQDRCRALRTLTEPLIVLLGRETAATLLKIDGLIVPGLVELCTPHFVHPLVVGPAEDHGRAESNVEVVQVFQSPD